MFSTVARRAISTTTRVHPPIPPIMANQPASAARRGLGSIRWVPTIFALVGIGYGAAAMHRRQRIDGYILGAREAEWEAREAERRRSNALLMDAYGDKSSLADLEKAVAMYEARS